MTLCFRNLIALLLCFAPVTALAATSPDDIRVINPFWQDRKAGVHFVFAMAGRYELQNQSRTVLESGRMELSSARGHHLMYRLTGGKSQRMEIVVAPDHNSFTWGRRRFERGWDNPKFDSGE